MFHRETLLNLNKKPLHELLFYVFLFLLPIQTRILYQPDQAYIGWYFNYHLAFFVYLSDLVLVSCFISWLLFKNWSKIRINTILWLTLAFVGAILVTLFHVKRLNLGLYQTLKWAELSFLIIYISQILKNQAQFHTAAFILFLASIFQAVIALGQFHVQHMLGLGFLGEYIAPLGTAGLATIETTSGKLVRAYGTMPHPNVLGAFLILGLILGFYLSYKSGSAKQRIIVSCGTVLIILGIFVSFSRLAWLAAVLSVLFFIIYSWIKNRSKIKTFLIISLVSCATILLFFGSALKARVTNSDPVSISDRGFFNSLGWDLAIHHPILGIGIGNYVPALQQTHALQPWQYQPPHNLFIFIAAELGFLGLGLFVIILFRIFFKAWPSLHESLGFAILTLGLIFLFMGQFDHYFITIQQGRLMFFTVLGLIAALPNLHAQKFN